MKTALLTLIAATLLGTAAAAIVVWRGWYDVSAASAHTRPVNRLLTVAMERSVAQRAADIRVPPLDDPALVTRGAACYRDHCAQCHGAPGLAQGPAAMGLQPLPGPLVNAAGRFTPAGVYWITRHGIKMTGMPAWELRLPDRDLWAVTAFVQRLPAHTAASYRESVSTADTCPAANQACAGGHCPDAATADATPLVSRTADETARLTFRQYACTGCHRIPGLEDPGSDVGPPLDAWARRTLVAGSRPNTSDELVRFIRHPRSVDPDTTMPELGVTEAHARLMATYLLAQH